MKKIFSFFFGIMVSMLPLSANAYVYQAYQPTYWCGTYYSYAPCPTYYYTPVYAYTNYTYTYPVDNTYYYYPSLSFNYYASPMYTDPYSYYNTWYMDPCGC
jgi:hypothetical protein